MRCLHGDLKWETTIELSINRIKSLSTRLYFIILLCYIIFPNQTNTTITYNMDTGRPCRRPRRPSQRNAANSRSPSETSQAAWTPLRRTPRCRSVYAQQQQQHSYHLLYHRYYAASQTAVTAVREGSIKTWGHLMMIQHVTALQTRAAATCS